MKNLLTLLWACIAMPLAQAQTTPGKTAAEQLEDSVFDHYMRKGAWQAGIFSQKRARYIDSALAILPHNAYLWQQKGMPLVKQNKYELSMPYVDSAVKYDPVKWLDYRAFLKCIFAKTYREALIDFDRARALNGNSGVMDHPYDFYSALCYLQLNQFDSAEIYLRKCIDESIQLRGENWVHYLHWYYMGIIYHEKEDYKTALLYFNKSLIDYPDFFDAEYYKACCQMRLNDYKAALATITKAKQDQEKGYTMNEDSIFYETYPYQVKKYYLKGTIAWIEEKNKE